MLSEESGSRGLVCGREPLSWKGTEEALVEAVKMAWRAGGGGGRWPFASDGPWHLMTREVRAGGTWDAWRIEIDAARERRSPRTVPLTAEEVDAMDATLAWLLHVPEADRKLVEVAVTFLAAGRTQVSWAEVRRRMAAFPQWREVAVSDRGLGMRYSRAVGAIANAVNLERRRAAA